MRSRIVSGSTMSDDSEDPKRMHRIEQSKAAAVEMSAVMGRMREALMDEGFHRYEAVMLCGRWLTAMIKTADGMDS